MLIRFWLGIIITIVLAIVIVYLSAKVAKTLKKQPGGGGLIGGFLGLGLFIWVMLGPSRLYVVTGDEEYVHYLVFGATQYELPNGETINMEIGSGEFFVINETDKPVVVEEVVYGAIFGGDTDWVYPMEGEPMVGGTVDYFFDNEPPDEISVDSGTDEVTRYWLRKKRD